jgi:hypothetical protein
MLPTVEFHHPAFIENGVRTAVRCVRNTQDRTLRLEVGAPLNSGEDVLFTAIGFELDHPRIGPLGVEASITIDNVNREMAKYLEAAVSLNEPVKVIFRGYLVSDPTTVGQGPYTLAMRNVTRSGTSLQGKLIVASPGELKFLRRVYGMTDFPSLLAAS